MLKAVLLIDRQPTALELPLKHADFGTPRWQPADSLHYFPRVHGGGATVSFRPAVEISVDTWYFR